MTRQSREVIRVRCGGFQVKLNGFVAKRSRVCLNFFPESAEGSVRLHSFYTGICGYIIHGYQIVSAYYNSNLVINTNYGIQT